MFPCSGGLEGSSVKKNKLVCSIGLMAFDEEKNIARALEALLSQKLTIVAIKEIYVIASGCTDKTVPIAKRIAKADPRIKVIVQEKREGKASAINLFLRRARTPILVQTCADTIPNPDVIEKVVGAFENPEVGMAGARPEPVDSEDTFFGFAAHFLWDLHHAISLKTPKMGELIAYRHIFKRIPYASVVDEANVEPLVMGQGYHLKYVPAAIVLNKGTENVREFLKQRRRIYCGHILLRKIQGYSVSTINGGKVLAVLLGNFKWGDWRYYLWSPGVISLEALARFLGWYDARYRRDGHQVWERLDSTKELA